MAPRDDWPGARVLVLTGPTATGKTEAAVALAEHRPVSLISMDSAMVYRGMDIGTAKPSPATLARHPHALVDIRDPAEPFSAAEFVSGADAAVIAARETGRLPVLVGGTMLYLRAFREGLADLPSADPALRDAIAAEGARRGWRALHDELARVDPAAAAAIHPNNRVRVQRALEVYRATGTPLSQWWARRAGRSAAERLGARLLEVAVVPERRRDLTRPIRDRFRGMLDAGLVDEVAGLRARGDLSPSLPSMRSVGYRQVWRYLDGESSFEELVDRGVAATGSLAKRQLTWLKGWAHIIRLAPASGPRLAEEILRILSR